MCTHLLKRQCRIEPSRQDKQRPKCDLIVVGGELPSLTDVPRLDNVM